MFHKTTFLCIPIDSFSFSFFQEPIDSIYRTQNDIWQCGLRVILNVNQISIKRLSNNDVVFKIIIECVIEQMKI
jgi:hypothetical protein